MHLKLGGAFFLFTCLLSPLLPQGVLAQTTLYTEDFETDGNPARYTTSVAEFTNTTQEYFTRTDGSGIDVELSGVQGASYFAAQAIGDAVTLPVTLTISGIDIAGHSNLELLIYLAEDDDGTKESWDGDDYVHIGYSIDGGAVTNLLHIENVDGKNNSAPAIDTNFDGNGDGTVITNTFTQVSAIFSGTGSSLDLVITFNLHDSEEDIALDQIQLIEYSAPTVATGSVSGLGETTATLGGTISSTGGADVSERGFYYSTTDGFADGTGTKVSETGTFAAEGYTLDVTGLSAATTYYFKAFATNPAGTSYGSQSSFTTTSGETAPTVTSSAASDVRDISVTLNGSVDADGGASVTERGFVYSSSDSEPRIGEPDVVQEVSDLGDGTGSYTDSVSGLSGDTQYYVQAYATNSVSTSYGGVQTFTTISEIATLTDEGYFEDFSNYNGSGFSTVTTSGHLHSSNWRVTGSSDGDMVFDGTYTADTHGALAGGTSPGNVSTSAIYAFSVSGDVVFGMEPSNNEFTPGTITLRLEYTGSGTLASVAAEYDIWVYNDHPRSSSLNLAYSTDDITYTLVDGMSFSTLEPVAETTEWLRRTVSANISGLSVASGEYLYLQWQTDDVSGNDGRDEFGLTNLTVSPVFGEVTGAAGWRMLSAPIESATYRDILGSLWTQCFTGARYNGAYCDSGDESNVRVLNSSGSYVSISDLDGSLTSGKGFAVYAYEYDDELIFDGNGNVTGGVGSFPKTITTAGSEPSSDVTPVLNTGIQVFTLLGNPYASAIVPYDGNGDITGSDISNVIYVYDHSYTSGFQAEDEANSGGAGGGWRTWNGSAGGLTDGKLAPYQGFLVANENPGTEPTISLPVSSKTTGGMLFSEAQETPAIQLAARINEAQVSDVWFTFNEEGSMSENRFDARALYALDYTPYLMFHTVSEGRALDIKNLPPGFNEEISMPLKINGWKPVDDETTRAYEAMGGPVEIIWPTLRNIPDAWEVRLTDHEAGTSVDLTNPAVDRYEFDLVVDAKSSERLPYRLAVREAEVPEKLNTRFTLDITAVPTSMNPADELPREISLAQNYPNPFNPSTSIRFELPATQFVALDVFDQSGRHVARIASGMHQAGTHTAQFDASGLSSGVYIYRLQTETTTVTRKFTLLK